MWRCEGLIRNLASHIIDIEGVIANFEQLQGQCALVSLKSSLIISSISLAEIYDLFATRDSYRERLFNALERGVHVTSSLGDDDVNFLDPFIQVSRCLFWENSSSFSKQLKPGVLALHDFNS